MPIRTHIPNIEAIREEIAALEEQRGILKSPEMIAALKAEITGLIAQRLKVLAEIDEAKKSLDDMVAKQIEQAEVKIKELQESYAPEQERLDGLKDEAQAELAKVTEELNLQKDAIPEVMATLESQKKASDKYIALIMAEAETKGRELDTRRTTYMQEFKKLQDAITQGKLEIEKLRAEQDARQTALDITGTQYAKQLVGLEEKERAFLKQQQVLEQRQADIAEEYAVQASEIKEMQDMWVNTLKNLDERMAELGKREAGIASRELTITEREADLIPKWNEILKREADLETNWKVYKKQKQALDYKLRELEG